MKNEQAQRAKADRVSWCCLALWEGQVRVGLAEFPHGAQGMACASWAEAGECMY